MSIKLNKQKQTLWSGYDIHFLRRLATCLKIIFIKNNKVDGLIQNV